MPIIALFFAFMVTWIVPPDAVAHGVNGHAWASLYAVSDQTDCALKPFLSQAKTLNAILTGSLFPDSGYAANERDWGEAAHWEPFVQTALEYVRERYSNAFTTPETARMIGFLFGAATHGFEDEIFDTFFVAQTLQLEDVDQDIIDTALDFALISEGKAVLMPDDYEYLPAADLTAVFARPEIDLVASEAGMRRGMDTIRVYLVAAKNARYELGDDYRRDLPWSTAHYLDPSTPGSIGFEVQAVAGYHRALWQRLHKEYNLSDLVIDRIPRQDQPLRSVFPDSVESQMALIVGMGVEDIGLTPSTVVLKDAAGNPVSATVEPNRWGGNGFSRVIKIRPQVPLTYDADYSLTLMPGINLVDGRTLDQPITRVFRTRCDPALSGCALPTLDTTVIPRTADCPVDGLLADTEAADSSGCSVSGASRSRPADILAFLACGLFVFALYGFFRRSQADSER